MSDSYECKRHQYSDLYEKLMSDKQCFGNGDYRVSPLSIEAATALSKLAQKVDSQAWRIERLEKALRPFAEALDGNYFETCEDHVDIWESPVATVITFGDLRAARAAMEGK